MKILTLNHTLVWNHFIGLFHTADLLVTQKIMLCQELTAEVFQIICSYFIIVRKESFTMLRVKERGTNLVIYEDKNAETGK